MWSDRFGTSKGLSHWLNAFWEQKINFQTYNASSIFWLKKSVPAAKLKNETDRHVAESEASLDFFSFQCKIPNLFPRSFDFVEKLKDIILSFYVENQQKLIQIKSERVEASKLIDTELIEHFYLIKTDTTRLQIKNQLEPIQ